MSSATCIAVPAANAAPKLEPTAAHAGRRSKAGRKPLPDTFNLGNMTGIPGIVLPCGFTAGPPVLPIGIQFYAKAFDEPTLFRVSHAYESATDWHTRRPPLTA